MKRLWCKIAVEDTLSEAVVRRLFQQYRPDIEVAESYGHTGFGLLKKRIGSWNLAAQQLPFLVLTDLDRGACAPSSFTPGSDRLPACP